MNLKLEAEYSRADIFKEIDDLKKQVDALRPLPQDVEGRVMQKLRLDWNYNSNAIEGNRLSYGETVAFLMEGITAKGKPLKDHLDIRGHNEAIDFLLALVKDERPVSESDIRTLHQITLVESYEVKAQTKEGVATKKKIALGEYKKQPNHVETSTGLIHYYASPEETPAKMQELMEWYTAASADKSIHPVVIAALFHYKFVAIHPFDDGNGRLSRILMNLSLMQYGYPPVVVKMDDRQNYYSLLSRADNGDIWPFIEYIAERLQSSLQLYLKAANGGDVDEDEDIDKEVALLKMQLNGGVVAKEKKSKTVVRNIFFNEIFPLALNLVNKTKGFNEFFFKTEQWFRFYCVEDNKQSEAIRYNYIREDKKEEISILFNSTEINRIEIEMEFFEYKNPENNFSLVLKTNILFEKYYYKLGIDGVLLTSKLYHEVLTKENVSMITKTLIQNFKVQIDAKTNPK